MTTRSTSRRYGALAVVLVVASLAACGDGDPPTSSTCDAADHVGEALRSAPPPGQSTEVEVRFEAIGDETRITVVHHGWDSVPQTSVVRHGMPDALFLQRHGLWWQALLAGLRGRIAG